MDFKDYYATLGVQRTATQDEVKRAYRKLARKFHPDVSKEPDAESRFKEVAEAHEALIDPERRAAYDDISQRHARGEAFEPPPGWDSGFEFSGRGRAGPGSGAQQQPSAADFSAFFESIFGRGAQNARPAAGGHSQSPGSDHHAKVMIDLEDSYSGARRTISLRVPVIDAQGHAPCMTTSWRSTFRQGCARGSTCAWRARAVLATEMSDRATCTWRSP